MLKSTHEANIRREQDKQTKINIAAQQPPPDYTPCQPSSTTVIGAVIGGAVGGALFRDYHLVPSE